jgi:hypothetical protein
MMRMLVRRWFAGAVLSMLASGCTTYASVAERIRPRAAFDLACPESEVDVRVLEGEPTNGTYGATGCGKRARYETSCSMGGTNCQIRTQSVDTGAK